jgi:hypothetical protein
MPSRDKMTSSDKLSSVDHCVPLPERSYLSTPHTGIVYRCPQEAGTPTQLFAHDLKMELQGHLTGLNDGGAVR